MKAIIQLSVVFLLAGACALPATVAISASDPPLGLQSESRQPPENVAIGRHDADPEFGSVVEDAYTNAYFGLAFPLPPGWTEDLAGPPPSGRGLYVLASIDGTQAFGATMLIVAEDLFSRPSRWPMPRTWPPIFATPWSAFPTCRSTNIRPAS
jgi:hypothetical protein